MGSKKDASSYIFPLTRCATHPILALDGEQSGKPDLGGIDQMTDLIIPVHPFEKAGLGKAPFRYDGHSEITFQAHPGAPVQAGGSCDYCGTGIRDAFWIKSADGRRFKVGCDCVEKTCKPLGPIVTRVQHEMRLKAKARRAAAKPAKLAALAARVEAARAALDSNPSLLAERPHSQPWRARQGDTARDEVIWYLDHAGAKGQNMVCGVVEKAIAGNA